MTTVLLALLLAILCAAIVVCVLGWVRAERRARWRIVKVDTHGRGPNADTFYHVPPPHEGRELWLTDEQVLAAKLRPDTTAKRAYETPL